MPSRAPAESLAAPQDRPTKIGPYHILEQLGTGGMGEVYKAERRSPMRQLVALKIIKLGYDTCEVVARFEQERQALALMDHPHIARVLDAGATEAGRPYFVMEHVPGEPITAFADRQKLSIRDRLELFCQVCDAVTHAHQKALIHRDIKASNVLAYVHDGRPTAKVIDFGIAKALTGQPLTDRTLNTTRGIVIGSYESMSPEQAEASADIDTRTDVYSLGALLYELLTGVKAFDFGEAADHEIRRVIREVEPPPPSTRLTRLGETAIKLAERRQTRLEQLARQLRSELEWIPLKAMRKERRRRYLSPQQLREDLQNYLSGRPLLAGPESSAYRIRKWGRRYRTPLVTAAAILLLIVGGTTAYIHAVRDGRRLAQDEQRRTKLALGEVERQKAEAEKQRNEAERRQRESEAVIDFINSVVFAGATPERMPDTKVRDEIVAKMLEPAARAVRGRFKDQPLVEAAVMNQIGSSFRSLGRWTEAEPLVRDALERRRTAQGEDHPDTIRSVNDYASVLQALGRASEAEPLLRDAMERSRRFLGADHPDTMHSLHNYADVLWSLGRPAEAERLGKDALERRRRVLGDDHPDTIASVNNYAFVLNALGRAAEAEPLYKEALDRRRRLLGEDHPDTIQSINNYAFVLRALGRTADTEPLFRDALERRQRVLGQEHPDTIQSINNYALVLRALGRAPEAEPLFRDAMERFRRVWGEEHPDTITAMNNYADALQSLNRAADAEPLYRDALERRRRVLGEDHPDTIASTNNYAAVLVSTGRAAEAGPLFRDVMGRLHRVLGEDHPHTIASMNNYAFVLRSLGRAAEAEPLFRDALERSRNVLGRDHPDTMQSINNYANVLHSLARFSEAEPLLRDALERRRRVLGDDHPDTIMTLNNYAAALGSLGRPADAEPLARRALERAAKSPSLGPDHAKTAQCAANYAGNLDVLGRAEEAAAVRHRFGVPAPGTRAASTNPTSKPAVSDEQMRSITEFVAALQHEWAANDDAPAKAPASRTPSTRQAGHGP